jgi:putative methionine-R-sulfoxide reductase with GAF domain
LFITFERDYLDGEGRMMTDIPLNPNNDDFEPRRPSHGDGLLSTSGTIAVADILKFIAGERRHRQEKADQAADMIRRIGPYRWVGIYDIEDEDAAVIAWSGTGPPAFIRFPNTVGLTGEAVRARHTIVANDVKADPRYLTSFAGTKAEIIVPVLDASGSKVVGTIDVESDKLNAFGAADQEVLEECARALWPLWAGGF